MRYVLGLGLMISSLCFAAELRFDRDGMALVNGDRLFILGLYENPSDTKVLEEAAEAGYNLIRSSENGEALDRLEAAGVYAWLTTNARIDFSQEKANRNAALEAMVQNFSDHPALLVWEVPDEALWNAWYRAQQWRSGAEPKELTALITALEDKDLAKQLRMKLHQSGQLRKKGDYKASEALADAIWEALGKTSPKPNFGLSNAPERAAKLCAGMVEGYQKLRQLDPKHPVWMNHAPRNQIAQLAAFNKGADVVGCDIYPVPFTRFVGHSDLVNHNLSSVGDYTDRMQAAAPEKPVWMVLQGFGWGDILPERPEEERAVLRRPKYKETRFMGFDAIVHGARGILYWGSASIEKDSQLWKELMQFGKELSDLQPVLSAPDTQRTLTTQLAQSFGSIDKGVRVLGKEVDGALWLIVVNEFTNPLHYTLSGLDGLDGKVYEDTQTKESATVKDGSLSMFIPSEDVQVLKLQ